MTDFHEGVPTTAQPCNECPWRRTAVAGWLGPFDVDYWLRAIHGEGPIACHKTIRESDSWEGASQCRGAAIFRANVHKQPRNPAIATGPRGEGNVFDDDVEFRTHHEDRRFRTVEVITAGGRKEVTLVMEKPGAWRHPSGLLVWKFPHQSARWHLGLDIGLDPLRDRAAYLSHPRWLWWREVRDVIGDYGGTGQPFERVVEAVERALARVPLPGAEEVAA